jgi:hypothetical protein
LPAGSKRLAFWFFACPTEKARQSSIFFDKFPGRSAEAQRYVRDSSMRYLNGNRIRSILLLPAMVCIVQAVAGDAKVQQIKLTDHDRASMIGFIAGDLFKTGHNYEGKHFILADGIRSEWIPQIAGYDVRLVLRDDIETPGHACFLLRCSTAGVETIRSRQGYRL